MLESSRQKIHTLFGTWFPAHRTYRRYRRWRWPPAPHEVYLYEARDIADLERRMRIWLGGWGQG